MSIYSDQVSELVALGAANCEPCFKYHYDQARKLGVGDDDMLAAVRTAQQVKQAPARAMLELAGRLLGAPILPDAPHSSNSITEPGYCNPSASISGLARHL